MAFQSRCRRRDANLLRGGDRRLFLGTVLGEYLVPTFTGNVIGGAALVAALNHAQVVLDSREAKPMVRLGNTRKSRRELKNSGRIKERAREGLTPPVSGYSYRNAWMGSNRAALKAGNSPANTPTAALKATATSMAPAVMTGALATGLMDSRICTNP